MTNCYPPKINISDEVLDLAEDITLADLLQSPIAVCDTISLLYNIINSTNVYGDHASPDDAALELSCYRLVKLLGNRARQLSFDHLRDRRGLTSNNK